MPTRWLIVGSVIYLVVVALIDLYRLPDVNLPILYAAPVLIISFTESVLLVAAMAGVTILLVVISMLISHAPLIWWPLTFASFLVICFLAIQTAGQRAFIRRHVAEAERARWNDLLLSSVAHELRTPLTVILGYAQVLGRNPNLPDSLRRPVAAIETSALRMRGSIDDLAQRWKRGEEDST